MLCIETLLNVIKHLYVSNVTKTKLAKTNLHSLLDFFFFSQLSVVTEYYLHHSEYLGWYLSSRSTEALKSFWFSQCYNVDSNRGGITMMVGQIAQDQLATIIQLSHCPIVRKK